MLYAHCLSIDYCIVYTFLLITFAIGLRAGEGIKDNREYALANKIFGTGALVLTWLAAGVAGAAVLGMISLQKKPFNFLCPRPSGWGWTRRLKGSKKEAGRC